MSRPTEAQCQDTIIEAAMALGFLVHHCRASRTQSGRWATAVQGNVGFPDLVIVGFGKVIAIELKRHPRKPSAEQIHWLAALSAAGVDARLVYVPEGMDGLIQELTDLRNQHTRSNQL